jgi:hypothetical protein
MATGEATPTAVMQSREAKIARRLIENAEAAIWYLQDFLHGGTKFRINTTKFSIVLFCRKM